MFFWISTWLILCFKSLEAALGYPIPVWKFHSVFPSSLNQTGGKSKWKFKNPIFNLPRPARNRPPPNQSTTRTCLSQTGASWCFDLAGQQPRQRNLESLRSDSDRSEIQVAFVGWGGWTGPSRASNSFFKIRGEFISHPTHLPTLFFEFDFCEIDQIRPNSMSFHLLFPKSVGLIF